MAICFLALGSNLGTREEYIRNAVEDIKQSGVIVPKISSIIETKPHGGVPQGDYLNAVVKIETHLTPQQLLELIQAIEKKFKRERSIVNGPRTLDIDILLYDQIKINTPELTIPHPRMFERDFVMIPLLEIAPELVTQLSYWPFLPNAYKEASIDLSDRKKRQY